MKYFKICGPHLQGTSEVQRDAGFQQLKEAAVAIEFQDSSLP